MRRSGEKTRGARLRWFRRDGCIGRRMPKELPRIRKRGRPKRRFMDAVGDRT